MKTININRLKCALSTIHKKNKEIFQSGKFFELLGEVHGKAGTNHNLRKLLSMLSSIWQYLIIIYDDILQLYQQKKLYNLCSIKTLFQKRLDKESWMRFATINIKHFYIDYRSLFDFLAEAIGLVSDSPGQIPTSFNKLKKWINNKPNRVIKLGEDLAEVVRSCDWFEDLRDVRDSIIHKGALILVFPTKDKILFQIHDKNLKRKILEPKIIMNNENVADFELYAGLYIGYLIAYLEEVSELIISHLNLSINKLTSKSYHKGLHIIYKWIEKVLLLKNKNFT